MRADPFTAGLAERRIRYQSCTACGAAQTLVRHACTRCGSMQLTWMDASGRGVVHAVTVVSRAPSAEFRELAPYTLVLVTLAEGPRLMAHGTPGLAIDQRVEAGFFEHAGRTLVRFSPSPADAAPAIDLP